MSLAVLPDRSVTGSAAETAYLDRTAYWVGEFEKRRTTAPVAR